MASDTSAMSFPALFDSLAAQWSLHRRGILWLRFLGKGDHAQRQNNSDYSKQTFSYKHFLSNSFKRLKY